MRHFLQNGIINYKKCKGNSQETTSLTHFFFQKCYQTKRDKHDPRWSEQTALWFHKASSLFFSTKTISKLKHSAFNFMGFYANEHPRRERYNHYLFSNNKCYWMKSEENWSDFQRRMRQEFLWRDLIHHKSQFLSSQRNL